MRVRSAIVVAVVAALLSVGCATHQRCVCPPIVEVRQLKGFETPDQAIWRVFEPPTDEVRAARLKFAAAVVIVAGEVAFEIIKAQR